MKLREPKLVRSVLIALGVAWLGACSGAPPEGLLASSSSSILGGDVVAAGAWPSVAWLDIGCTATLVHPEVVVYAGHCGTAIEYVWFGDAFDVEVDEVGQNLLVSHSGEGERGVPTTRCGLHPFGGIGTGKDLAFCVLAEPVTDARPVFPAVGCEAMSVAPGVEATLVGYGFDSTQQTGLGTKRSASAPIVDVAEEITIGSDAIGTCAGDSGGPAFVRVPSGAARGSEWRLAGVLSSGAADECGLGFYTDVGALVGWLEGATRRKVTPCFDGADRWQPQAACESPMLGEDGAMSPTGWSPGWTCGDPYQRAEDGDAPTVQGRWMNWDLASETADLAATASDAASGVRRVELSVRGNDVELWQNATEIGPFEFAEVPLVGATHAILSAEDQNGNLAQTTLDLPSRRAAEEVGTCAVRRLGGGRSTGGMMTMVGVLLALSRKLLTSRQGRRGRYCGALLMVCLAVAACGKAKKAGNVDASGAGAGGETQGTPVATCPDLEPEAEDACDHEDVVCSYGDSPRFDCRNSYACQGGTWVVSKGECRQPQADYCPDDVPIGQSCVATAETGDVIQRGAGAPCEYGDTVCLCYGCASRTCQNGMSTWECSEPPALVSCPVAPPNLGTACEVDLLECGYGDACQPSGLAVLCRLGAWERVGGPCPE